jgi:hypothetical protein
MSQVSLASLSTSFVSIASQKNRAASPEERSTPSPLAYISASTIKPPAATGSPSLVNLPETSST